MDADTNLMVQLVLLQLPIDLNNQFHQNFVENMFQLHEQL